MVYSNGRTIDYNYSGANLNSALDNAIGRLDSISDPDNGGPLTEVGTGSANSGGAGQVLEQYSYLGLNTIVGRSHPQTFVSLSLHGANGSIGSGGDSRRVGISAGGFEVICSLNSVGLDRFGRVVDQYWINTSTGQSTDNFTYTYDNNSNVASENNLLNTAYSQTFTYDPLNRLASNTLGGVASRSWNLDSQGNWSSYTSNGTTQTRTANAQNQITSISGTAGAAVTGAAYILGSYTGATSAAQAIAGSDVGGNTLSDIQRTDLMAQASSQAAGTAAIEGSLTQLASVGDEFSHCVPARWGGPRNPLNGDFASVERHGLTDPYRYKFMPKNWKAMNPIYNPALRLFLRIPNFWKAVSIELTNLLKPMQGRAGRIGE